MVGFLLLAMPARGADISREQALYFRGFDNLSAGATNERVKGPEAALEYYLKARECFKQVLEEPQLYIKIIIIAYLLLMIHQTLLVRVTITD